MPQKPHVIIIMADQLRDDFIQPTFTPLISNLNSLAALGKT